MMSSSAKGKYSVVTLSIRLVCVDLHVMVLYNRTFFSSFLRSKRVFSSFQMQHDFPGEIKRSQDSKHPWETL